MTAGSLDDLSIQGLSYTRYPVEKMPSKKLNFNEANSVRINRNLEQKRRAAEFQVNPISRSLGARNCCREKLHVL